eukprot:3775792-Pleurochrysis_carterae.AAC.2
MSEGSDCQFHPQLSSSALGVAVTQTCGFSSRKRGLPHEEDRARSGPKRPAPLETEEMGACNKAQRRWQSKHGLNVALARTLLHSSKAEGFRKAKPMRRMVSVMAKNAHRKHPWRFKAREFVLLKTSRQSGDGAA